MISLLSYISEKLVFNKHTKEKSDGAPDSLEELAKKYHFGNPIKSEPNDIVYKLAIDISYKYEEHFNCPNIDIQKFINDNNLLDIKQYKINKSTEGRVNFITIFDNTIGEVTGQIIYSPNRNEMIFFFSKLYSNDKLESIKSVCAKIVDYILSYEKS